MSLIGTSVGHIRIVGDIGRGGMGEVYAGMDETLQRRVALKAIRAEHRLDPAARARFLREARMLSQLDNPHICRIYDYVEGADADFLVLELIDGRTLTGDAIDALDRAARFAIAEQVAGVLVTAHERGIVHRDLKPANVMVTGTAGVKVLDFGIARPVKTAPDAAARDAVSARPPAWIGTQAETGAAPGVVDTDALMTAHGTISGSAAYMSPEQARGEQVTTASDMYAFGLLLQELFTGRPPQPLDLPPVELIGRAARGESLPPEGVDPDLRDLIGRLKQLAPAARPTAVETAGRLRWIREKPRRLRRRVVAAAAIVLLLAGVLKYTLDLRAARAEAESRRGQAEDLIGFMLGDLRARLAPVGRLEILDEVGAKALAYFDSLPPEAQNDEELMRRARALSQIGEVRLAKGDADGAIAVLNEALALASRGVERQPARTDWLATLGATHFWIGYAHWNRNELDSALGELMAYRTLADRLVQLEPGRTDWKLELAQAESNLGSIRHAQGRFVDAGRHFQSSLEIKQALADAESENPRWKQEVASSLSWLGESLYGQGRPRDALRQYQDTADILTALTASRPDNTELRLLRAIAHTKVALVLRHLGRAEEALAENRKYERLTRSLVAHDPLNAEWKREHGVALVAVALDLLALERPADALVQAAGARALLSRLVADDGGNADWRRALASAENATAAAHLARRHHPLALDAVRRGRDALGSGAGGSGDRAAARHRAEGYLLEAEVHAATGRAAAARQAWTQALDAMAPAADGATRADLLWPRARALVRLGRRDEARPILDRLAAQDFRPVEFTGFCRQHRCEGAEP